MISLWPAKVEAPRDTRSMRQIAEAVAMAHGLTLDELKTHTSVRRISHPRHEAMAIMYATGRFSYPQIGRFFNMDHTSAIHGKRAHEARQAKALEAQAA